MPDTPKPYERQPGESAQAFSAFVCYRDLGQHRSLDEVCRLLYSPTNGDAKQRQHGRKRAATGHVQEWSTKFNWVKRTESWDAEKDAVLRMAQLKAIQEMAERHAQEAVMLQAKALEALSKLNPEEMSAAEITRMYSEAVKLERLARGEPDQIQEQRGEGTPLRDFFKDVEQYAAALQTLAEKNRARTGQPATGNGGTGPDASGNWKVQTGHVPNLSLLELLAVPTEQRDH